MSIFDISPRLHPGIAVFPGDQALEIEVAMDFPKDHLKLSAIRTTVHLGAHLDAPSHFHPEGKDLSEDDPGLYLGPCRVLDARAGSGRIQASELAAGELPPRVLFRTDSFPDPDTWNPDFRSLSPGLVEALAKRGVFLVGIDTPSVDPADSKALESHQALARTGMRNLEGVVLNQVPPGDYDLIALPLALAEVEASLTRALLLPRGSLNLPPPSGRPRPLPSLG